MCRHKRLYTRMHGPRLLELHRYYPAFYPLQIPSIQLGNRRDRNAVWQKTCPMHFSMGCVGPKYFSLT